MSELHYLVSPGFEAFVNNQTDDERLECLDPLTILIMAEEEQDEPPQSYHKPPHHHKGKTMETIKDLKQLNKLITGDAKPQVDDLHVGTERFDRTALVTACSVITNPMDHLDTLINIAPANEYFAANAIVGSLGYSLLNQMLWNFRKLNAKPKAPAPTIDIFNDSYAEKFVRAASEEISEDNGHTKLPEFNATALVGVYMHMLYMQRGNVQFAEQYPVRMPHEILHEMQIQDRTSETAAAYEKIDAAIINASPAALAILAEKKRNMQVVSAHQAKQHEVEQAYILTQLKDAAPERLTEAAWQAIPLYIQYKWTVFVYKQVLKAIVQEQRATDRSTDKFDRLIELVGTIQLELEAAASTSEVKQAFIEERLDERHELIKQESKLVRVPHEETVEA